jgi:hypothetical protein
MTDLDCPSPCPDADAPPAHALPAPGLWARLRLSLTRSDREAYFARATDLADLERRQHAWERSSPDASLLNLSIWR